MINQLVQTQESLHQHINATEKWRQVFNRELIMSPAEGDLLDLHPEGHFLPRPK